MGTYDLKDQKNRGYTKKTIAVAIWCTEIAYNY